MKANYVGRIYGRLTVIEEAPSRTTHKGKIIFRWLCRCECGNFKTVDGPQLLAKTTRSCGCLHRDNCRTVNVIHGRTRTKEYRAWLHAKDRCYNPNDRRFKNYGARGIGMCDEWRNDFSAFFACLGIAPTPKHTLERVDRNVGYQPGNCIWAIYQVQANNTSTNVYVEYNGEILTLDQIARKEGLRYSSFCHLFRRKKLPVSEAVEKAVKLSEYKPRFKRNNPTELVQQPLL